MLLVAETVSVVVSRGGISLPPRPPGGPGMPPPGRAGPGPGPGPGPGWDRGPIGNGNGNGRELGGGWSNKREADWRQPNAGGDGGPDPPSAKRGRWDERGMPGGAVNRASSGWDRGPDDSPRAVPPNAGPVDAGSGWDRRSNGNRSDSDSSRDLLARAPSGGGWQQPRPPPSAAMNDADRGAPLGGSASAGIDSRGRTGWDQVRLRTHRQQRSASFHHMPAACTPGLAAHRMHVLACCVQLPSSMSSGAPSSSPRAGQQTPRGSAALPPRPPGVPPAAALHRQQSAPYGSGSATPGGVGGGGYGQSDATPGGGDDGAYSTPHVAMSASRSPWPTPANDKQLDRQILLSRQASAPGALGGGGSGGSALPPRPAGPAPGSAPARPLGNHSDGMGAVAGLALDLTGAGQGISVGGAGRPTPRASPRSSSMCVPFVSTQPVPRQRLLLVCRPILLALSFGLHCVGDAPDLCSPALCVVWLRVQRC